MSSQKQPAAQYVFGSPDNRDALHFTDITGAVVSWIDNEGFGQGNLNVAGIAPLIQTVKISNSQLLNMSTVPVVLIPAPGLGKYISPQAMSFQLNVGTIPFQIANSGAGNSFVYWAGLSANINSSATYFPDSIGGEGMDYTNAASQLIILPAYMILGSVGLAGAVNEALVMSMDDALSVGNGTMTVTISYTIVTI